ncbi:MAG: hypothetical protein HYS18_01200 [Burkholderiales bacterium]|nr:hypothetical protein [Burkholderiales bacterium]
MISEHSRKIAIVCNALSTPGFGNSLDVVDILVLFAASVLMQLSVMCLSPNLQNSLVVLIYDNNRHLLSLQRQEIRSAQCGAVEAAKYQRAQPIRRSRGIKNQSRKISRSLGRAPSS